jgi:ATP-dependent RNA helicase SUPV3L1/SUV3
LPKSERARRVGAVLGPTNTGKTHYAIERMLSHPSGMIGLPLRLLAREVYNRVVERVGPEAVALITGEEKIKPRSPRYWIATVEAMPRDIDVAFVALDEAQLAADLDRGHIFTDRLLNRRGLEETLIIGAATIGPAIEQLLPGATVATRPRLSRLWFAGDRKISRLPRRSAIVAFSAEDVYAVAEFIRRQRGGAAVVLGALSPRTRNAQVDLYQNGEVDYIVATDAIGMGLNLDVDHVAFASDRKFDGWQFRRLTPAEFGQIAGRAGRNARDGSFGSTGRCPPFEAELAAQIEDHAFDPVALLQWRNSELDFASIEALQHSLDAQPDEPRLTRAPLAEDVLVLDVLSRDPSVQKQTKTRADVQRLWEACQVPDYRKTSPAAHADLARTLFGFVVRAGRVPDAWFATQLGACDRPEGDIDALSARLAHVRTLNFIANRPDWLGDPEHWQSVTRRVEDTLSDALHERLAARFVDRRTSVLMRRLRETGMLEAEVTPAGDVLVEGQHVGSLQGFCFTPDPQAEGEAARTLNAAAQKALASEIDGRATRVNEAVDSAFVLANDGTVRWLGEAVGRIVGGDHMLSPGLRVLADEQLTGASLELVQKRLDRWLAQHVNKLLGALRALEAGEGLEGMARGLAFQIAEALGVLERARVSQETRALSQDARGALRKLGVRFGAYHLYLPALLKPAPRSLAAQLWALKHGGLETVRGLDEVPHLASSGRTSFAADETIPRGLYLAAGFRVCGERAVRVDMLERLADLIRPAIAYRPGVTAGDPPSAAADDDGFVVSVAMTSLVGCSGEPFASILKSLGYVCEKRPGPAITKPILPAAPRVPLAVAASGATAEPSSATEDAAQAGEHEFPVNEPRADAASPADAPEESEHSEIEPRDLSEAGTDAGLDEARADETDQVGEAASPDEPVVAADPLEEPEHLEAQRQDLSAVEADAGPDEAAADATDQVAETASPDEPVAAAAAPSDSNVVDAPQTEAVQQDPSTGAEGDRTEAIEPSGDAAPVDERAPQLSEPQVIEVWKPQRRSFGPRRRPKEERSRAPSRPAASDEAPSQAAESGSGKKNFKNWRGRGGAAAQQEGRQESPRQSRPSAPDRPRMARSDRPERPARSFGHGGPEQRVRRERPLDPDSPFAKLAALKAELEAKNRKDT